MGEIVLHIRQDSYCSQKWKEIEKSSKNRGGVFVHMENKDEKYPWAIEFV